MAIAIIGGLYEQYMSKHRVITLKPVFVGAGSTPRTIRDGWKCWRNSCRRKLSKLTVMLSSPPFAKPSLQRRPVPTKQRSRPDLRECLPICVESNQLCLREGGQSAMKPFRTLKLPYTDR